MADEKYNFEFITAALGLLPILNGQAAINTGAVIDLKRMESGGFWQLRLSGDLIYSVSDDDLAEIEQSIKRRAEMAKAIQKEQYKQNMKLQAEAMNELQGGVAPGVIVPPAPKRFRQQ